MHLSQLIEEQNFYSTKVDNLKLHAMLDLISAYEKINSTKEKSSAFNFCMSEIEKGEDVYSLIATLCKMLEFKDKVIERLINESKQ